MKFAATIVFALVAIIATSEVAETITVDLSTLTKLDPKNQGPGTYMGIGPEIHPGDNNPSTNAPGPVSAASGSTSGSISTDICSQKCTDENNPVCGTDGVTYGNLCKMQMTGCDTSKVIWKKSDGPCPNCQQSRWSVKGQCDPNADGTFPDACNQYIGAAGQPDLGFCVGGTLQDNEAIAPYPHNYWFSFPNSCPLSQWSAKTEACREEYSGGMCALGVEPDGKTCTFSYEVLGYIPLDDVVGITSIVNPDTGLTYANYSEFCLAGGVEFSVTVSGDEVTWQDGLDFWANPRDSEANAERAEKLVTAYSALVEKNAVTSDGGVMRPLPTVSSLTDSNPPCYENSDLCADAELGPICIDY